MGDLYGKWPPKSNGVQPGGGNFITPHGPTSGAAIRHAQILPVGSVNLEERLRNLLGPEGFTVNYYLPHDSFVLEQISRMGSMSLTRALYLSIMATSSDQDEEKQRLLEFFWGTDQRVHSPATTMREQGSCSFHEWVEVTLFHTPQLRCRFCDIKKTDATRE